MAEEENNINLPGRFAVYGAVGGKPAVVLVLKTMMSG